jgi:virulence-associated protein VagC
MEQAIPIQVTETGILIPDEALGELNKDELEVVREDDRIVIRPKRLPADDRAQVRKVLRDAGLLYEPDWEQPPPVSPQERACLAEKLASGTPLSEEILAEREDRA